MGSGDSATRFWKQWIDLQKTISLPAQILPNEIGTWVSEGAGGSPDDTEIPCDYPYFLPTIHRINQRLRNFLLGSFLFCDFGCF